MGIISSKLGIAADDLRIAVLEMRDELFGECVRIISLVYIGF